MKAIYKLMYMKTKTHMPQLLGIILLLAVGAGFFITLFTIVLRYEEAADQYFVENAYADVSIYGDFENEHVRSAAEMEGVILARGRHVRDFREEGRILRAVGLTKGVNTPFLYEGRLPQTENETVMLKRNAEAMGFAVGDTLMLGGKALAITGLAASPEYIYLAQNERNMMAEAGMFGVIFVTDDFFGEGYNEIVMLTDGNFSADALAGLGTVVMQSNQINYILYREDLGQIRSFAIIFPLVFAVLIAVVIYVMLSRSIQKDRTQIGTMKALGVTNAKVIGIYLFRFCFAACVGAMLGGIAAVFICGFIIDVFTSMFEVPALRFVFYPSLWLLAVTVSVLLCAFSGLAALSAVLPLLPAHAMRPKAPKSGKRLLIERATFLWRRLSFNSRYALKSTLRNKGRFVAAVLGMCGSCALLAFSLGFRDSFSYTQERHFSDFTNYDVIVDIDPLPLSVAHPASAHMDARAALTLPVEIHGDEYVLTIVENDFDMLALPLAEMQNGVAIPAYFAQEWGIGVGDALQINGHHAVVSAVIPQYLGLMLFTSFDYAHRLSDEIPPAYNVIYGRHGDMAALSAQLSESGIGFSTIDDDRVSFYAVMESVSVLIVFMIACAVVLGLTVLYSVGMISLSAREHEYMFIGVMGYPHGRIMAAHVKEVAVQLVLAVPLGFLLGNLLLESIKGTFSGAHFVIAAAIFPQSYLIAAATVVGISALMAAVISRHVKGLDIVEGLKAQGE